MLRIAPPPDRRAGVPAKLGEQVHVAGVFQGRDLRLYIDGELAEASEADYPLGETSGGLFIGGVAPDRLPDQRFFHGVIDAVRISRGVRYDGPFTPPARLETDANTLASFPFSTGPRTSPRFGE